MSNKFALLDIMRRSGARLSVVLVSWVDSAEIASLVEEISIQPVDWPLAQSVDSPRRRSNVQQDQRPPLARNRLLEAAHAADTATAVQRGTNNPVLKR